MDLQSGIEGMVSGAYLGGCAEADAVFTTLDVLIARMMAGETAAVGSVTRSCT